MATIVGFGIVFQTNPRGVGGYGTASCVCRRWFQTNPRGAGG